MTNAKKLTSKILVLMLALAMVVPFMQPVNNAYAAEPSLQILISKFGAAPPKATTNPFDVKEGEYVNVAAMVADETGHEVTEEDYEFGDSNPVYTKIQWNIKESDAGITLSKPEGTINRVTGVKAGTYHINLTYKDDPSGARFKPLEVTVNVLANADAANKVHRIEAQNPPSKVKVGETVEINFKGYNVNNGEVTPNLRVKTNVGSSFVSATAQGSIVTLRGVGEGEATITIADGEAEQVLRVTGYEDRIWDFDKTTGTLNGFKKKTNNPTDLVIPAEIEGVKVKKIGREAFRYSTYATSTKVQNRLTSITLPEGLEETGYMSFQGNNFTSVTIPQSMTLIGERTFFGNENLTTVNFAEGSNLDEIGAGAFYNSGLREISLPTSVTKIQFDAFKDTNLTNINLHEGITHVGAQAFAMTSIEELRLPSSVTTLNESNLKTHKQGSGLLFRTYADKSTKTVRFAKVYDTTGNATALNTRAVVNPVPVTIQFHNAKGQNIQDPIVATGYEKNSIKDVVGKYNIKKASLVDGDMHYFTDYMNPYTQHEVYSKDDFAEKIIGENYFSENKTYDFKAPFVKGYKTPANQTKMVTKTDNTVTFVYEEADKVDLALEGEGLTSNFEAGKVPEGVTVDITVHEPAGKVLDQLLVKGTNVKDNAKFDGVDYKYSFDMEGNTTVTAVYTDSDVNNELTLDLNEEKITLGKKLPFTPMYRGKAVPHENLNITFPEGMKAMVDEKAGTILPQDAGDFVVTVALKEHPEVTVSKTVKVEKAKLNVRLEDDKNTVLENTPVEVDKLYLTAGETYYKDLNFDHLAPVLAIEKALKGAGVNTALQAEFDCGDTGNWMVLLGKDMWKNINADGSYMYYVNNKYADKGVGDFEVTSNDNIYVYYDPNWKVANAVGYFETEEYEIFEGDEVEFKLMGTSFDWNTNTSTKNPIVGVNLEINDGQAIKSSEVVTSAEGKATYTFETPGTYYVSAISKNTPAEFTRPKAKVVVKKKPVMKNELVDTENGVKVTFLETLDVRDVELHVEKLTKNYDKLETGKYEAREIHLKNKETGTEIPIADFTNNRPVTVEIMPAAELLAEENLKLFVEKDGALVAHKFTKGADKVTFTTDHLSPWTVGVEKAEEPAKPDPVDPPKPGDDPVKPGEDPAKPGDNGGNPAQPGDNGGNHAQPGDNGGNPAQPGDNGGNPAQPGDNGGNPAQPGDNNDNLKPKDDGANKPGTNPADKPMTQNVKKMPEASKAVKTGDSSELVIMLGMFLLASTTLVAVRRKKTNIIT